MQIRKITFLLFSLSLLFVSCKKSSDMDPLSNVVFSKNGVIRVECVDCALSYTVLKDNYAVTVKNSEEIKFSYVSDFELKTTINTTKKQAIRLAVFDAYGRIVSNQLTTVDPGEQQTDTFSIKIN
jgi:hypothetical protein